ncbi:MAG TPA: hypothetical protein VLX92_15210 [Kofleriaceae bacterium]|nr:hypothetical protein [Kofleriaceae bacterium]
MLRWIVVFGLLAACGNASAPAPSGAPSEGALDARKTRDVFRGVIAELRDDIVAHRLAAAYARLAPETQARLSQDAFAAVANNPVFASGVAFHIDGGTIAHGTAKMTGWLAGPSGRATLELRCTAVAGAWRISGLRVDGAALL